MHAVERSIWSIMNDVGRVKSNEVDRYEISGIDLFQMDIIDSPEETATY